MPFPRYHGRQRGQATIEYTIVVLMVVIVLIARPDVVMQVVQALRRAYETFVYAISVSTLPI